MPSSVPGGTVTMIRFCTCTSPDPLHVGHAWLGTLPLPRHTGHGRFTAKLPCPKEIVPRPLHSGHCEIVAPGAAPLPPHVGHTSVIGRLMGILPPSAAMRNGIASTVSTVSSTSSSLRRPKIDEKRSPSPPNPPRSEISKSSGPADAGAPPADRQSGRGPVRPAPVNAPYLRSMSYFLRFSVSLRTSCASLISLKRSAAWGLLGLRSG